VDRIGRYRIVKELGRGAMGIVYQAVDPTIGRTLAIKTIRLREVDDPAQRARLKERLFREARSAGVLSHPGIITIYDMEEDDGLAYIAMQFVNGPTLDELMSRPKPMGPQEIFQILRQTAAALDFAHGKGIIHRDIKPANIMIDEQGMAKVADFGIAKVGTSGNLTLSGTILGTPNYMSPEQVQGKIVDGRADQFSLGVVAYEILTGERPFAGEHLGTVVYKIVAEEPVVTSRVNPTLSPAVDAVIRKALSKKADGRYRTCTEFINALEGACLNLEGWRGQARGASLALSTEAKPSASRRSAARKKVAAPPSEKPTEDKQGRPGSMVLPALGAFLVVLGLMGLLAWQAGVWHPDPLAAPVRLETSTETKPETAAATTAPVEDVESPPPAPAPTQDAVASDLAATSVPTSPKTEDSVKKPEERTGQQSTKANVKLPAIATTPAITPAILKPSGDPQDILVQTNPPGATAVLDGATGASCQTPCVLLGAPGNHILALTLANYQKEIRQVRIKDSREDVPLVSLRPEGGTLMVSTNPAGANIFIDGKLQTTMTPSQFTLSQGSYQVMVERDGVRKTQAVDIVNGNTNYVRILLDR
jgi:serine/threonine protein kinase